MKQHRFWAWGAVFCMLMCIYTGKRRKLSKAEKAPPRRPAERGLCRRRDRRARACSHHAGRRDCPAVSWRRDWAHSAP